MIECGGLGRPHLAAASVDLANLSGLGREREGLERLGEGVEAMDRVAAEVTHPHVIDRIDEDGVRRRIGAGQPPQVPGARSRRVPAELAGVPLADPDRARGVLPHSTSALVGRRRIEHRHAAIGCDRADVAPGQGGVEDPAIRRRRDAIGASSRGDSNAWTSPVFGSSTP